MNTPAILDPRTKTLYSGSSYRQILKGLDISSRYYLRRYGIRGQATPRLEWIPQEIQDTPEDKQRKLEAILLSVLVIAIAIGLILLDRWQGW